MYQDVSPALTLSFHWVSVKLALSQPVSLWLISELVLQPSAESEPAEREWESTSTSLRILRYVKAVKRLCHSHQEHGRMAGGRRGLVAPQNTFLENIVRRSNGKMRSCPVKRQFQFVDRGKCDVVLFRETCTGAAHYGKLAVSFCVLAWTGCLSVKENETVGWESFLNTVKHNTVVAVLYYCYYCYW